MTDRPARGSILRWWHAAKEWFLGHSPTLQIAVLVAAIVLVYLGPEIFYSVGSGQAAVIWRRFGGGTDVHTVFSEGLHVKAPWNVVYLYDIRLQRREETYDVLSKDGLRIEVVSSVRFRIIEPGLGELHRHVGPNYVDVLIVPELGAQLREEIGHYEPEELYSARRAEIEEKLLEGLREEVRVTYLFHGSLADVLHVEDVFLQSITLPPLVTEAIDEKLAQRHHMLEYDYRLQKEEKEAQRKEIEARGIRAFQDIVSEGISDRYLRWKGVDATLALAQSQNAKIVVIGAGGDGLPIILGGLEGLPAAPFTPAGPPTPAIPPPGPP